MSAEPASGASTTKNATEPPRYEVLQEFARGGMAVLYLARVRSLLDFEKYVVLKRMSPQLANDPEFGRMFLAEARHAAKLDHPNIVHVSDLGRDDEGLFYVMEYVHGEDLRALIAASRDADRRLEFSAVVAIGVGAAAALHHAHTRKDFDGVPLGLVHRDVSPTNILVSYEGVVKLVDFGIAKATTDRHQTRPSIRKGKIGYLSPEQCKGATIDARSDVFALGIVLHELLTCEKLYDGESEFAVMNQIVNRDAPPPSTLRPDIPAPLDDIVVKALQRDPAQRFGSALELQRALDRFAASNGISASTAGLADTVLAVFGPRALPWEQPPSSAHPKEVETPPAAAARDAEETRIAAMPSLPETRAPRRRTPLFAAAVVAAGIVATWAMWPTQSPPPPIDAPQSETPAPPPEPTAEPVDASGSLATAQKPPPSSPPSPVEPAPSAAPPEEVTPKPTPTKPRPRRRPNRSPKPEEPRTDETPKSDPAPFDPDGLGPLRTVLQ